MRFGDEFKFSKPVRCNHSIPDEPPECNGGDTLPDGCTIDLELGLGFEPDGTPFEITKEVFDDYRLDLFYAKDPKLVEDMLYDIETHGHVDYRESDFKHRR
nr:MAG TPA: hypothetical protein [Caudoviricetes sp.]